MTEDQLREIVRQETAKANEPLSRDVRLLSELLRGNGDPSKGLIVKLDRLTQRVALMWGGSVFLIAAVVAALVKVFIG